VRFSFCNGGRLQRSHLHFLTATPTVHSYQNISATPGEGSDYLLLSFAATILGGVYMYGGEGTIPGVLVGVICLASVTSALTIAGVPPSIYQGVLGVIVLAVVLFQARLRR
jgi:ribose/xylose/arabinose/galactoside ABC-type transport system permease subunit